MAKFLDDSVFDAALAVADNATTMHVTSSQPANHAGIAAVSLGSVALTAGAGNGDYTLGNGDTNGRKLTVATQSISSASASGTATHVCGTDGTTLLWVATCTSQSITSGNPISVPAFDIELNEPT
jgi:hypothetical protein